MRDQEGFARPRPLLVVLITLVAAGLIGALLATVGRESKPSSRAAPAREPNKTAAQREAARDRILADNRLGRFKAVCKYSHSAPDDPIVHFGEPGASHRHDFFGNTSTNASSTYQSMRAVTTTTCNRPEDEAAYWAPSLSINGQPVQPRRAVVYYLTGGKPKQTIKSFPPDFRIVTVMGARDDWLCAGVGSDVRPAGADPKCPSGKYLILRILFPDCLDGRSDSPDHRSHAAYSKIGECPADHPIPVPQIRFTVEYPPTDGVQNITLSSGGPDTVHADYLNTWDQQTLDRLVQKCINAGIECGTKEP
jgi:hypothetical protein